MNYKNRSTRPSFWMIGPRCQRLRQMSFLPKLSTGHFEPRGDDVRHLGQDLPLPDWSQVFSPSNKPTRQEKSFGSDTMCGLVIELADESSKVWKMGGSKRGEISTAVRTVIAKYQWPPDTDIEHLVSATCRELGRRGNRKRHALST